MRVKNLIGVVFFILVVFGGSLLSGEKAGGLFGAVLQDTVNGVSQLNSRRDEDSEFPTQYRCKYDLRTIMRQLVLAEAIGIAAGVYGMAVFASLAPEDHYEKEV